MSEGRYVIKREHTDAVVVDILFESRPRASVVKEGLESESDTGTTYEVKQIEI